MKQELILRQSAPQLSNLQLREWQRYRGWTTKILEELEHSGGMTTHEISNRTGCKCHQTGVILRRMWEKELVDRVDRWGWRITVTGFFLLSLNYVNTSSTQHQHSVNTPSTQEKEEPAPKCFALATCHIKQLCKDKRYTEKNRQLCHGTASCIWGASGADRAPVEIKVMGVKG